MAFNINEIRSQLAFGGARPNLFSVQITNPADGSGDAKVPFMVQAAQIPSAQLGTIQVPYFGRMLKLAGDRTFEPWTVSVINDEDFKIRNALEAWSNRINRLEGNVRTLNRYKSEATVTQFAKDGQTLRIYQFSGLFPSSVSPIELAWGDMDTYEAFQVTFEYDYWSVSGGKTGNGGGT